MATTVSARVRQIVGTNNGITDAEIEDALDDYAERSRKAMIYLAAADLLEKARAGNLFNSVSAGGVSYSGLNVGDYVLQLRRKGNGNFVV